ncbi:type II secretion system F family protein [Coraliomargarita algicola]|uniref:Type II secretion system F family protein n=1 Tax=Coraliomargarita algicola TaxID=3092156 RepID=A0ABZ0RMH7_9BACT|nr:type II secretion system F family protein [Coraliomargarita sp. J2-16]WPJ97307.1 type II secretion system F family protein [Coraliomargarita sp. J2-16]
MASHQALSNWYTQLGQHLEAGVLLSAALRLSVGPPQTERFAMADRLEQGKPFYAVMATAPQWLPRADRQFLLAGMQTGNLPRTLEHLSARHASIGATQRKLLLGAIYPLLVLHITALLLPVARMIDYETGFNWSLPRYLIESTSCILPIWLLIGALIYLARNNSPWMPRILRLLPIFRHYSHMQAMGNLAYALGTFIAAGVPVPSAWRLSVKLVNDPRYTQAVAQLEPIFAAERDPSTELKQFKCFPADFTAFYQTGAQSGKLDTCLLTAGRQFQERANRALTQASIAYPSGAMAAVACIVIYIVFNVFRGYLQIFDSF